MMRFTLSANDAEPQRRRRERLATHHRLPRPAAQYGAAAGGAGAGRDGRAALAGLCAEVSGNHRRDGPGHRAVRRVANAARSGLCLCGRLAHRLLGPAALGPVVPRSFAWRLPPGALLASLAGAAYWRLSLSRLERF